MNIDLHELIESINYSDDCIAEISEQSMLEAFQNKIDLSMKKNSGASLIALAALYQSQDLLDLLGLDINIANKTEDAATALMLSVANNNHHAIQFLLDTGADVNAENKYGETALFGAVFFGNLQAVKLLLAAGAATHAQSEDSNSPLDALLQGFLEGAENDTLSDDNLIYLDIAKCLVAAGIDLSEQDEFGNTFIDNISDVESELTSVLEQQDIVDEDMTQAEKERLYAGLNRTVKTLQELKAILTPGK